MGQMMPLILFAAMLLAVGIVMLKGKNNSKGSSTKAKTATTNNAQSQITGVKKNTNTDVNKKDMSSFMHFDKIANDMIYQKHGARYTMVVECKGINYELMSEMEQMAVEEGFTMFLNTLKFPIQLYVQTRSIDLSDNIKKYKERVEYFEGLEKEKSNKYNKLEDDIDASMDEVKIARDEKIKYQNISEYVSDITNYVEKMALNKYMLQRKFYIILSYNKADVVTTEKFTDDEFEEICYRELYTRAQGIIASLSACSISSKVLTSNQLAELIYISYNKDEFRAMDIKKAMESGFYRMYSTSEDVWEKKQQMLDDMIFDESMKRIDEAIRDAIDKGIIVSSDEITDEMDKRIDKTAVKIVEQSNLDDKTKEDVKDIIIDKRRKRIKEKKEKEKEEKIKNGENVEEDKQLEKEEIVKESVMTIDAFNENEEESEKDKINAEKAFENKNIKDGILKDTDHNNSTDADDGIESIV